MTEDTSHVTASSEETGHWDQRGFDEGGLGMFSISGTLVQFWRSIERLYELRQDDLATMPYRKYLRTDHWQEKRREALARADNRCQVCNGYEGLDVHHRTYKNRGNEQPNDLTVLCRTCHSVFHLNRRLYDDENQRIRP